MSFLKSHLGMARWHCVWLIPEFFTYPKVNHFPPDISFTMKHIRNTWKHQPFETHTSANKRNSSNMATTLQTTSDYQIGSPRSPNFFDQTWHSESFFPNVLSLQRSKALDVVSLSQDKKLMWHKSSKLFFGDWSVSGTRGTWTWQWLELDHPLQWRSSKGANDTVDLHKPREWWETHNSSSNWVLQMYVKSFYPSSRLVVHLHSSSHPSKHLHRHFLYHFDISRT